MHHSCQTAASFLNFTFEFRGGELEIKYFCQTTGILLISISIMVHWLNSVPATGQQGGQSELLLQSCRMLFDFTKCFCCFSVLTTALTKLLDALCSAASLSKCFKFLCLKHQPDHCGRTIVDQRNKLIVNLQKTICSIGTHLLFMKTK